MSAATKTTGKAGETAKKIVTLVGQVESDKGNKTRKVVVRFQSRHAKYGKYLRQQTVIQAHDEKNTSKMGDTVEIAPCRPKSKTKSWQVVRVVSARVG